MALKYTPDIGNYPPYNNHSVLLGTLCSLKNFKCITTKQMISLRLGHERRNEKNDQLKECEPEIMTYEYHTEHQLKLRTSRQ